METALIILIIVAALVIAGVSAHKQQERDKEAGVVTKFGAWRLTPTHVIVGNTNDSPRHELRGLHAEFAMSGDIARDTGRYTATRLVAFGPLGLAMKKGRNKKIDDREGYLSITGRDVALLQTVPGTGFGNAQRFVLAFNRQVHLAGNGEPAAA